MEMILAILLEKQMSKWDILHLYLNKVTAKPGKQTLSRSWLKLCPQDICVCLCKATLEPEKM